MVHNFVCSQCNEHKTYESDITTGYGRNDKDEKFCYDCIGKNDAEYLKSLPIGGKFILYLDTKEKVLTNWPASFKIKLHYIKEGRHNIARKRYDTWFSFHGNSYHAVQYGDFTQIAHVKRIKN